MTGRSFAVDPEDADIRLDRWFKRHLADISFNVVSRWARTGEVRLDGRKTDPGERLVAGQTITMPAAEATPASTIVEAPRRPLSAAEIEYAQGLVVHKDKAAIVINKPAGLATQGGTGTTTHVDGLLDALSFGFPQRPKLVHRLDKDTSGVLLLARTARAAAFFSKAFAGRTARKAYWALNIGMPEPTAGEIDAALAKQPGSGGEKMHVDPVSGQRATTRYRVLDHAATQASWIEFQPLTGRTHQIRVHASALGHPIVGDAKYGGRDAFLTGGISRKMHLHARRLVIEHPDGGVLDIAVDLPPHMADSFAMLGFDLALGDVPFDAAPDPEAEARGEAAAAKSRRKAHRGERRSRGSGEARKGGDPGSGGEPRGRGASGSAGERRAPTGRRRG